MRYIDLFAGIGGFRLGIQNAFSEKDKSKGSTNSKSRTPQYARRAFCVYTNEWDKYASQIYEKNFKDKVDTRDITTIRTDEIPDHDLLCAGFPCQAFSVAGKRKGFDDTRGTLFFDIARVLKDKRPRYFILENVKGLLSHDGGKTFQTILRVLTDLGYLHQWQVLNSKDFGVPQNRERVFIVGHLRGTSRPQVFPFEKGNQKSIKSNSQGNDIAHTITNTDNHRGSYIKSDLLQGVSNKGATIRRLTPTECERLQGFPDNWTKGVSDTQRYKMLGNAVTVNVVEAIINRI